MEKTLLFNLQSMPISTLITCLEKMQADGYTYAQISDACGFPALVATNYDPSKNTHNDNTTSN